MFIPTNSDGLIFVNLRKKKIDKKILKKKLSFLNLLLLLTSNYSVCLLFFFSFSLSGTHMSLFISFFVRFSPETIYFVRVSISFILIEYSLNIYHFFEIFLKSRFQVSL